MRLIDTERGHFYILPLPLCAGRSARWGIRRSFSLAQDGQCPPLLQQNLERPLEQLCSSRIRRYAQVHRLNQPPKAPKAKRPNGCTSSAPARPKAARSTRNSSAEKAPISPI